MLEKLKKHQDDIIVYGSFALVIAGTAVATALITTVVVETKFNKIIYDMNRIANEAGVLQDILDYINP